MNYNNRLFKTGIFAIVATALFAAFMYRVAQWSNGTNGETAAPRQRDTNCTQITKVIPQMPLGSFDGGLTTYSTVIHIVNTTGMVQMVNADFYKEDGTALDNIQLTAGTENIGNGVLSAAPVVKEGVMVISGGGTTSTGVIAWGKITACTALSVSTFFELRDAKANVLLSRVGVPASPANMSSFVIPRIRDVGTGLDVGFAVVNTAASGTATVRAELKDAAGVTVAVKDITMGAGVHRAGFTKDLFAPLNDATDGRIYQYVKFSSTSPTFAAIALAFEGSTQTSFLAESLQ